MRHDLYVDRDYNDGYSEHWGKAKCYRCGETTWSLCCYEDFLTEDCESEQLELFALTDFR